MDSKFIFVRIPVSLKLNNQSLIVLIEFYSFETGHKPLQCIHCMRRFSDPSNLNKHQRLHDQHKQWNKQIEVKS